MSTRKAIGVSWAMVLLATAASALPLEFELSAGQIRFSDNLRAAVGPIDTALPAATGEVTVKLPGRYFLQLEARNTSFRYIEPFAALCYYRSSFGSDMLASNGTVLSAGIASSVDAGFCTVSAKAGLAVDLESYTFADTLIGNATFKSNGLGYAAGISIRVPLVWHIATALDYTFLYKGNKAQQWTIQTSRTNGSTVYDFTPSKQRHMIGFGLVLGL
ncbi:MAG TPA: hypothetical protein VMF29_04870 [Candidatus Edwardsbacteria bacterium]|nr:hypothetical protein [Candidatus Edwardsbacteria bacterium]